MKTVQTPAIERVHPPYGLEPALFALMLGTFTIGTGEFGMMGLLPAFAHSMHITLADASAVISAYAAGVVIGAPVIAVAGANLPRRTLLLCLLCLFVAGNIGTVLAPTLHLVEIMRFITGLPHGAFFGVAALTGASMVEHARQGRAISRVLSGIMFSTVIGAPLCTFVTEYLRWESVYAALAVLGVLCFVSIWYFVPHNKPAKEVNALTELGALGKSQVLLTLLTGAIGFGGLFGIYTFLTSSLGQITHLPAWMITLYQVVWGCGMVAGNSFGGAMIDRNLDRTTICGLAASACFMLAFSFCLPSVLAMLPVCFLLPAATVILSPAMQSRLMDVAGNAQTLAASLNHSAFNIANAVGAWAAAMMVEHGFGLASVGWSGALFSIGGLLVYLLTITLARHQKA